MRITGVKTLLKVSPAILALFAVGLASQQPAQLSGPHCPPPGYNPYAFANNLENASFGEVLNAQNPATSFSGVGYGGNSAVASWSVFNKTHGTTTTSFHSPTLDLAKLHISTTGAGNGILQSLRVRVGDSGGTFVATVSVRVHTGRVCIGAGTSPTNTVCAATSTKTFPKSALWSAEALTACVSGNVVAIFSAGGPADFSLLNARLTKPM